MIKPIGEPAKIVPLKKQAVSAKTDNILHETKSSLEDKINLSPEALGALQIDQLVLKTKELPQVREEVVAMAERKIRQSGYLETVVENLSDQIASLFLGSEARS